MLKIQKNMVINTLKNAFKNILLITLLSLSSMAQEINPNLISVASFGKSMAIGLSVNSQNRVFVAFPNSNGDGHIALAEVVNNKLKSYPEKENKDFIRVQDLFVDKLDYLWVLDSKPGSAGNIFGDGGAQNGQFKLFKINTKTNKIEKVYDFKDLDKSVSALNDVRVDTQKNLAYLSDPGQAAIVVLDLTTGKSRNLLKASKFTSAENRVIKYNGTEMKDKNGKPFSSHVNGIALTHDFKYFYFKPINKEELYRIETKYLADATLSAKELESKVEFVQNVGITHGLIADAKGNIYLTTSESFSISYVTPNGDLKKLITDPRLLWPDSLGIGTDGYLYFSCAQLQRLLQWNNGEDKTEYPYQIFKTKLPK